MISKISGYSVKSSYNPSFESLISKSAKIPVKPRRGLTPQNIGGKFFGGIKEVFFETFPKFDPEYNKFMLKNSTVKFDKVL